MSEKQRTYPSGVTSWIDVESADPDAAADFYRALLRWETRLVTPPDAPDRYLIATLDGRDVAGLGESAVARWNTYVAVDDADAASARITAAGGRVVSVPVDVGAAGRTASCEDPLGLPFRLWQARDRLGVQVTNTPGAWNFSNLLTDEPERASAFYADVFGWEVDDLGFAAMIRVPGYGDHLAATTDPDIHERQAGIQVPPGFADAIGWVSPPTVTLRPQWHVAFTVDDRDATAARAEALGATILDTDDSEWTRDVVVRDPQGALFTASQFDPQGG